MNDRPGHRDDPHSSADLDIDIELEPAEGLGRSQENATTTARLRSGLAAVAGFLTLFHLLFIVVKVTGPASGPASVSDAPTWSLLLRAVVAGLVFVLLRYAPRLTGWQVRALELFLLGVEMLTLLAAQYLSGMDLIDQNDLVDAVAVQKNGVIRTLVLMVCWGVFVPRGPTATARTVVTMAAALILCHGVVLHHADTAHLNMDDVANHQIVMSNALFLIMGVALSTLAAWVLRGRDVDQNADQNVDQAGADRVGPYRLIRKLDEGGAGEVYLAEHEVLKRQCGLKIVRNGGPDVAARFEREARAAAQLLHPNTVAVFDSGRTADGSPYLAMEYLPGRCSADIVHDSGPMPSSRAVHIGRQVCGALTEAHRLGLIHRDLSPSNVFVSILGGRCDVAKLLDFGAVGETTGAAGHAPASDGLVAGTPEYAAPELAVGSSEVDCRADVYGLGGLLYFLVCGQPPFVRDTAADVLRAHVSEPVTPPREHTADIPADVEAVILRCLAKRPEDRFPDTRAVADALAACGCAPEWSDARAEAWWLEQASASAEESGPLSPQA